MSLTAPNMSQNRSAAIHQFLEKISLNNNLLSFLAGDASFRKYYRLQEKNQSLVLMDAPPPENPGSFVQIAELLNSHGFSAPKIIASDIHNGFVLLEDFGDQTYTKILNSSPARAEELYFLAIDTLANLHKIITVRPTFLKPYSSETHLAEAMLFLQWTYPAIKGVAAAPSLKAEYQNLWETALQLANDLPQSIVLRDFHVDNLMVLSDREGLSSCGLLDFQDALWGSAAYDLVSLLEDARRDIPKNLVESCWNRYLKAFPEVDASVLRQQAAILSAARHAKILGIFTRLAVRDHKPHYLEYIPRVWRLLQDCLKAPVLSDLNQWFLSNFPLNERIIPVRGDDR